MYARAGMKELNASNAQTLEIASVHIHPKYIYLGLKKITPYDFGVVKLKGEFKLNFFVSPVQLANGPTPSGTKCLVSGFGRVIAQHNQKYPTRQF